MKAEVIIFDLDDTLIIEKRLAMDILLETCKLAERRFGIKAESLLKAILESAETLWRALPEKELIESIGISSWEGLWGLFGSIENLKKDAPLYRLNAWKNALAKHGINDPEFAEFLGETFFNERKKQHELYEETLFVLETLEGKYRLGIITNGDSDLQREKINGVGIGHFFENIMASGDINIGKPDARIFETLLMDFNVKPQKCVLIGNCLEKDVFPAQALKMTGIWINRENEKYKGIGKPDYEIKNLKELIPILENLNL